MGIRTTLLGLCVFAFAFASGCAASAPPPPVHAAPAPAPLPEVDVIAGMKQPDLPPKDEDAVVRPMLSSTHTIGLNNPDPVVDGANRRGSGNAGNRVAQGTTQANAPVRSYYRSPGFLSGSTSRALSQGSTNGYSNANGSYAAPQSFGPRAMQ